MTDQSSSVASQPSEEVVTFTREGALTGAKRTIPVALSVCAYGLAFGVLAQQAKLSVLEVLLMSTFVFAGSSQLIALGLWSMPLPIGVIIFTTLVVNLRNMLMGVTLSPWFRHLAPLKAYTMLFFLSDESWALTTSEFASGKRNAAFLVGSGLVIFVAWVGSTGLGRVLGDIIHDPTQWGLDFAFTAVFLSLLVGLWKGKSDLLPWIVAALVAIVAARFLPGKWYILLGGLAGSIAGGLRRAN